MDKERFIRYIFISSFSWGFGYLKSVLSVVCMDRFVWQTNEDD